MIERNEYDVLVIGAGPAGSAASATAARNGLSVLHVERDAEPRFKIGESLMPETYWAFERMGALDLMRESGFTEKYSVQFYARNGRASAPFYFHDLKDHECSRTWQVHRADFDERLFENARAQGAECHRGVTAREIVYEENDPAEPQARGAVLELPDKSTKEVGAKVVIDASGQSTLLARRFDLGKVDYGLRNASIFTHFAGALRDEGRDEGATMILQTIPDGDSWFWIIPLAGDVISVGVVGDASYLKRPGKRPHEVFFEEVAKCPEVARRIEPGVQCRPVQVLRDFSYRYERMAGSGWILVGDAFSFIDPVYSSGVFLALHSGVMAADAAARAIETGDLSADQLGSFRPQLEKGMHSVLRLVRSFYDPEFSFGRFLKTYPQHQSGVTRILIGDVFEEDFDELFEDMATMLANAPAVGASSASAS